MSIKLNDSIRVQGGKPVEDKRLNNGVVYNSVLQANTLIEKTDRYPTLEVAIKTGGVTSIHWYKEGIENSDLVLKQEGGGDGGDLLVSLTYSELKTLVDNSKLIPGTQYRITDYVTTTNSNESWYRSVGNPFDIIVTADSENILNENARAIRNENDTYFPSHVKFEKWELKYSIHNDVIRYNWADSANGKGVIYYMKDDNNNELPYDFKNIQFKRRKCTSVTKSGLEIFINRYYVLTDEFYSTYILLGDSYDTKFLFTFHNEIEDNDLSISYIDGTNGGSFFGNVLKESVYTTTVDGIQYNTSRLNNNVWLCNEYSTRVAKNIFGYDCQNNCFGGDWYYNTFGNNISNNTFGTDVSNNTFGNIISYNTFGNIIESNTFGTTIRYNTFGNDVRYNTFGTDVSNNTFGTDVSNNTFGTDVSNNTFGTDVSNNTFGNDVSNNTFESNVRYNTFESNVRYNTFGTTIRYNTFGNDVRYNTFGNDVRYNTFGNDVSNNTFGSIILSNIFGTTIRYNTFGNDVRYNTFGTDVSNNTFGGIIWSNIFGNIIRYNTFGTTIRYNTFGNDVRYNTFGSIIWSNIFGTTVTFNVLGSELLECNFGDGLTYVDYSSTGLTLKVENGVKGGSINGVDHERLDISSHLSNFTTTPKFVTISKSATIGTYIFSSKISANNVGGI